MKKFGGTILLAVVVMLASGHYNLTATPRVQRFGSVIELKPEQIARYEALHAPSNPGVRDLLTKYNIHNYTIYLQKFDDGKYYLFSYYEYTGTDFKGDMEKARQEPRNLKWWSITDKMQTPFEGQKGWTPMIEVFHND